jgi:hypothetical protein
MKINLLNAIEEEFTNHEEFIDFIDELIEDLASSKSYNEDIRLNNVRMLYRIKKKSISEDPHNGAHSS